MKNKIPVSVLGATGMVGQKLIELLSYHPWFEIVALAASERSQGKKYSDAMRWMMGTPLPQAIGNITLSPCLSPFPTQLVFSGLDSEIAGPIEEDFARAGHTIVSNARSHRMDIYVPLIIPEVNSHHLPLVKSHPLFPGMIVTNPNCSVIGIVTALKPIVERWGISAGHIVTLQAISGAGYPGVASFDILDNVIPFIAGEEEKIEKEPLKILGTLSSSGISPYEMRLSAQCNRVPVMDGHMACVSIQLKETASEQEIISIWENFSSEHFDLPTAPKRTLIYHRDERHPQPKIHRDLEKGMAISIGRLRRCSLLDWKFTLLSHNIIRGAAGCALLNAELLVKFGFIKN
jgi:aspartate-semialdehyde dehydrogenase